MSSSGMCCGVVYMCKRRNVRFPVRFLDVCQVSKHIQKGFVEKLTHTIFHGMVRGSFIGWRSFLVLKTQLAPRSWPQTHSEQRNYLIEPELLWSLSDSLSAQLAHSGWNGPWWLKYLHSHLWITPTRKSMNIGVLDPMFTSLVLVGATLCLQA